MLFFDVFFFLVVNVNVNAQPPPIQPSDNQMILADLYVIKVIGKGNGGVVQLVQHKWTGQFFALKVTRPFLFLVKLLLVYHKIRCIVVP